MHWRRQPSESVRKQRPDDNKFVAPRAEQLRLEIQLTYEASNCMTTNPYEPPPIAKRYCTACGSVVMGKDAKCQKCGEAESPPTDRCAHCQTLWRSDYPHCLGCGRTRSGNYSISQKSISQEKSNVTSLPGLMVGCLLAPLAAFIALASTCISGIAISKYSHWSNKDYESLEVFSVFVAIAVYTVVVAKFGWKSR